jgi:hypothetical protein
MLHIGSILDRARHQFYRQRGGRGLSSTQEVFVRRYLGVGWPWLSSFESPAHPVKSLTSNCPAPGAHSSERAQRAKD